MLCQLSCNNVTTVSFRYQTVKYQGLAHVIKLMNGIFRWCWRPNIVSVHRATYLLATDSIKQRAVLESYINPNTLCTAILQLVGFAAQFSTVE